MLTWKSTGNPTPVYSPACDRFTIEPGPRGFTAYRFEHVADTYPVESTGPMMLDEAKWWCEARAFRLEHAEQQPEGADEEARPGGLAEA